MGRHRTVVHLKAFTGYEAWSLEGARRLRGLGGASPLIQESVSLCPQAVGARLVNRISVIKTGSARKLSEEKCHA